MEAAIQTVVKVFLKSAKGGDSMGGKDFDNLVKKQLGNVLTDTDSKDALKEMRKGLDENQDGKVSFEEYMSLIGYLATSMSDAKTKAKEDPPQTVTVTDGGVNSAPVEENNKAAATVAAAAPAAAAAAEPAKMDVKKLDVALPEVALPEVALPAVSAAAEAVLAEGGKAKEVVDGALAAVAAVAEGEVKVETS